MIRPIPGLRRPTGITWAQDAGRSSPRYGVAAAGQWRWRPPQSLQDLDEWLAETILNPSAPLRRGRTPVRPGTGDQGPVAVLRHPGPARERGEHAGQDRGETAARFTVVSIADPVIQFHHTITLPRLQIFQRRGRAAEGLSPGQADVRLADPRPALRVRRPGLDHHDVHGVRRNTPSAGPAPLPSRVASTAPATRLTSCRCALSTCRTPAPPG